jgi:chemotaxis protein CheD
MQGEIINTHYLYPAALFSNPEPHLVNTILGSCVAVCLYDPVLKIGGINHYMLPFWNGQELASPKYGNIAIEKLLDNMIRMGSQKKSLVAKVFGGGEVLQIKSNVFNIGRRNVELAFEMIERMRIPIKAKSVGGKEGRKIQFNTFDGSVKMKFVAHTSDLNFSKMAKVS